MTNEEFEEIFGNVPFENIEKIQKYIQENYISRDEVRGLINARQFELQQEYKDFQDDIRLNTLQDIYCSKGEKDEKNRRI